MDNTFLSDEKLYRCIFPPDVMDMFWRKDNRPSSAAFKDKKGLSVERGYYREDIAVANEMKQWFKGRVVYIKAQHCFDVQADIVYKPTKRSKYHTEIHGSKETLVLSSPQSKYIADNAIVL